MILNHQYTTDEYPAAVVRLGNKPIENVKSFIYLGCTTKYNEPSTGDNELEVRIDTAECKFYEISKNLLNHRISLTTRVKILNSLVRSRLTNSCQTWTLTKKQANHINAVYVSMLRKMVKGGYRRKPETYHYELTNANIIDRCKTETVHQFTARLQRNFTAHVIRQDDKRLLKCLLFNDDMQRKPGHITTLYKMVVKLENITPDEFNQKALLRRF